MGYFEMKINFKAIIAGSVVALCLSPFLDVLIFPIVSGLVVGFLIDADYLDGIINGLISAVITTGIFFPVLLLFYYPTMFSSQTLETILIWVISIIIGGLGGVLGVFTQKMIGKIQKRRLSKKKDNGYLICNNCGENYFLKEGETSDDFSECDCGGKFDYKKPFKAYKKSEDLNKSSIRIRIIAIALGAVIYLVPFSFFVPISGFVASYMAGGRYRDGIVNSAVACYIGGLIYFFSGYIGYSAYSLNNVSDFGIVLIIDIILAIIGGIIGIYIKNRRIDKGVLKGVFACNKCKSYYELPLGETNEDYDLICECGSKIKQAKKTSLIVLVIGYIFAISGGLIGLFIGTYLYSRENPNAKFHGRNIIVIAIISIILGLFLILLYPNYLLY